MLGRTHHVIPKRNRGYGVALHRSSTARLGRDRTYVPRETVTLFHQYRQIAEDMMRKDDECNPPAERLAHVTAAQVYATLALAEAVHELKAEP